MTHRAPRIVIVQVPAGGGHKAAASALAERAAAMGCEVEVLDALAFTPKWFAAGYVSAHLTSTSYAPQLYGFGYRRMDRRHPMIDRVRRSLDQALGGSLCDAVMALRPDAVIATHFYPLSVLGAARLDGRLPAPLIGVVTDYCAHAMWAEPGVDLYCAAPGGASLDLVRHGVPPTAIHETGIPVRPAFGRVALRPSPCGARTAAAGRVRVLMTSGGHGIGPLEVAIQSFAGMPQLELTVVCGQGGKRLERVRRAARRAGVTARLIGFEPDMAARIAEADIVVGKAGGLTVSEALACGRPMALFGTCPGQEQHNEDWLALNGAAVAVDPATLGPRIEWLRRSGRLAEMARAAQRLGRPDAASAIVDRALRVNQAA